jgi:hypothetical protein
MGELTADARSRARSATKNDRVDPYGRRLESSHGVGESVVFLDELVVDPEAKR